MKKMLFPRVPALLHGGDYNPDQWLDRPDILEEDIRMMKKAGVNTATLGVFAWSAYEPTEDMFNFAWLKEIMDHLYENGIYTVLATPTGAKPAWLDEKYPEALRCDSMGVRFRHGNRHNHCLTSPAFRVQAEKVIRRLADAVGSHPGLICWHISNELGGECYCPLCAKKFQGYLSDRFDGDIQNLNKAWWTAFWSHSFNSFDQIEPPYKNGDGAVNGLFLAWKQFSSWNLTEYVKFERNILKEVTPDIPVTTNFMRMYPGIDYYQMAKEIDLISWDSYPAYHSDGESFDQTCTDTAFVHAMMRGMKKDQPFLMMESTPSLVNWHAYNKLRRPGVVKLSSLQAIACGSDSVQYFQWRKGRGSFEQYHGAVIDHLGTDDTRVFKEVAEIGAALKALAPVTGSVVHNEAAVLYSWNNRWAIDKISGLSKETKYVEICMEFFRDLERLGIAADVQSPDADLSSYKLVAAPMLYILEKSQSEHLMNYVKAGGTLVLTYLTGYADGTVLNFLGGFPGDGLHKACGLRSEEIDTLCPSDHNGAVFGDGTVYKIRDFAEILRAEGAEPLAVYESDFYGNTPVVMRHRFGEGSIYYIAARLEESGNKKVLEMAAESAGVCVFPEPENIELLSRTDGQTRYDFYLNNSDQPTVAAVRDKGRDLLTGDVAESKLHLEPYGSAVIAVTEGQA